LGTSFLWSFGLGGEKAFSGCRAAIVLVYHTYRKHGIAMGIKSQDSLYLFVAGDAALKLEGSANAWRRATKDLLFAQIPFEASIVTLEGLPGSFDDCQHIIRALQACTRS